MHVKKEIMQTELGMKADYIIELTSCRRDLWQRYPKVTGHIRNAEVP